jgi:hypothetical protein
MLIIPDPFERGVPALFIMIGVIAILAFLRLGVPRLIERFQKKKPLESESSIKKD